MTHAAQEHQFLCFLDALAERVAMRSPRLFLAPETSTTSRPTNISIPGVGIGPPAAQTVEPRRGRRVGIGGLHPTLAEGCGARHH